MRLVAKAIFASLLSLLLPSIVALSSDPPTYRAYMPIMAVAPTTRCLTYKATMWLEAPATVYTRGGEFEVTAFLRNDDCSHFAVCPVYSLR